MERFQRIENTAGQQQDAGPVQAKLEVGREDDAQEKEADHVADKVMRMSNGDGDSTMPAGNIRKMPSPEIKKMPQPLVRKMPAAPVSSFSVSPSVEKGISSSKGAGQKLDNAVQEEMSSKIGSDFSEVNVHTNAHAQQMSREIGAKAFTHGNDIYFNQGQYNPSSEQGKHLLAHELTHTVQQSGNVQKKVQRSALASWEDATPADQKELFDAEASKKEKKNYAAQEAARQTIMAIENGSGPVEDAQKKLEDAKKLLASAEADGKMISLPVIDKIMRISANYHYQRQTPSPVAGQPYIFDNETQELVQQKLRMSGPPPHFWPHIKWVDSHGAVRDIGVKMDIRFIEEPVPAEGQEILSKGMPAAIGDLENVRNNPWDNEFTYTTIDAIQDMDYRELQAFCQTNNLANLNFAEDNGNRVVRYTPPDNVVITYTDGELFKIKQAIRAEWARINPVNPAEDINNSILGLGSKRTVTIDPEKSGPGQKTYKKYEKYGGIGSQQETDEYYSHARRGTFDETKTTTFPLEDRRKMRASVIAHEIGHNIGMAHSDIGIMSKATEVEKNKREDTSVGSLPEGRTTFGSTFVKALEVTAYLSDDAVIPANIQKLVNRVRVMTDAVGVRNADTGVLADVNNLWGPRLVLLLDALRASNDAAIFDDPFLVSLLEIPYDDYSIDKKDQKVIESFKSNGFLISLADWNLLTEPTKTKIRADTIATYQDMATSGSGHTFFENTAAMNTF